MKIALLLATVGLIYMLRVNHVSAKDWTAGSSSAQESPVIKDSFPVEPFYVKQTLTDYWIIKYPCIVTKGIPTPEIYWRWFKNGAYEGDITPRGSSVERVLNGTHLSLRRINPEESYQCVAHNKFGVALSNKISMRKSVRAVFKVDQEKSPYVITKNADESLLIKCSPIKAGEPAGEFSWELDNKLLITDERVYINEVGSLVFVYLTETDGGLYTCNNKNTNMMVTSTGSWTKLKVNKITSETTEVPIRLLYNTPDNSVAMYGRKFTMQCIFGGKPIPQVTWGGEGAVKVDTSGHTLEIRNVTEEYEGCYTCTSSNEFERDRSKKICIDVKGPPIWVQKLAHVVIVTEETDAKFHCKAREVKGEALLVFPIWMKNGNDLKLYPGGVQGRLSLSIDGTTLTFEDVRKDGDICNFQCSYKNDYGEIFADVSFNVIYKTLIEVAPVNQIINRGDVATFNITAKIDPLVLKDTTYTWNLDGHRIEIFDVLDIKILKSSHTLIVNTSQMDEDRFKMFLGNYSIVIDNGVETVVKFASLKEHAKTGGTTMDSALLDAKWIALIVALVLFFIIFILLLCILFNRHGGDDYSVDKKERKAGHDPEKELADGGFHDLPRTDDDPGLQKTDNLSISSVAKSIGSDTDSMGEYSDTDAGSRFNEDGSFIGAYQSHESRGNESNV